MKLSTKNQSRLSAAVLAGSTLIQFIYARTSNENTSTTSNRSSNTSSSTSAATIGILSYVFTTMSNSSFVQILVDKTNNLLVHSSALSSLLWTNEDMVLALMMCSLTLVGCQFVLRMVYKRKKAKLMKDLHEEREKANLLEEKLNSLLSKNILHDYSSSGQRLDGVRLFMDGAFDMMHYGHMNAFRLAQSLGAHLIVGVNSDESITQCKGPPLMNDSERITMVQGCKFVNEIIPNCPYIMNEEYLNYILEEYNVDYVIHGDDPCIVDGKDVYETAKKAGKFKSIPRTEGVSTTDIVGRMLLMNKDHHCKQKQSAEGNNGSGSSSSNGSGQYLCQQSKFLTTSRLLRLFSHGMKAPDEGMKVIYVDGDFDMFHPGHVNLLECAKKRGDYLVVGVHGDALVNQERGSNLPLMNLHERVLSVLGCRFVDDVLIDAPEIINENMIQSLRIDEVVHFIEEDSDNEDNVVAASTVASSVGLTNDGGEHPLRYQYPKDIGMYVELVSSDYTTFNFASVIERIQANQTAFQAKIKRKKKVEEDFYTKKYESRSAPMKKSASP